MRLKKQMINGIFNHILIESAPDFSGKTEISANVNTILYSVFPYQRLPFRKNGIQPEREMIYAA